MLLIDPTMKGGHETMIQTIPASKKRKRAYFWLGFLFSFCVLLGSFGNDIWSTHMDRYYQNTAILVNLNDALDGVYLDSLPFEADSALRDYVAGRGDIAQFSFTLPGTDESASFSADELSQLAHYRSALHAFRRFGWVRFLWIPLLALILLLDFKTPGIHRATELSWGPLMIGVVIPFLPYLCLNLWINLANDSFHAVLDGLLGFPFHFQGETISLLLGERWTQSISYYVVEKEFSVIWWFPILLILLLDFFRSIVYNAGMALRKRKEQRRKSIESVEN